MFPNPQSALPLPLRPSLDRYRKIAKELVKICNSSQADDLHRWALQWVETVVQLSGIAITSQLPVRIRDWVDEVESFARRVLMGSEQDGRRCALADAQFVLARCHGFESWPRFATHLASLTLKGSLEAGFEAAVDAVVGGDAATLKRLLHMQPELIRTRSTREHGATLLHYVSANGVEGYRQRTPENLVEIAGILLRAGAEVDAAADVYGGGCTALGLAATSVHPERAGVQEALLQVLLDYGAEIEPDSENRSSGAAGNGQSMVMACLANGRGAAAEFFSTRVAHLDLIEAAAVGRMDLVRIYFAADGGLRSNATPEQLKRGFLNACQFGRNAVVEFLLEHGADLAAHDGNGQTALHWAVIGGHLETVELLLKHRPPLEAVNAYGGTVMGQANWSAAHDPDPDRYISILEMLFAAGAKLPERLAPVSTKIDAWLEERGSYIEREWSW
jgi:Ankyrin repeats (3 copies)